jgi:hypothetical protein
MRTQSFLLGLVIANACTGGQGGDPGESTGGMGAGAGGHAARDAGGPGTAGGDMGDDCFGERWENRQTEARKGSCTEGRSGTFVCACWEDSHGEDEVASQVMADSCAEALLEACEIDLEAARVCTSTAIGTCVTTDATDIFRCQCEGSEQLIETEAASCTSALSARCADTCESTFGGCQQSVSDSQAFGCRCTGAIENLVLATGYETCEAALADRCGERCGDEAGDCTIGDDAAFDCACRGGESVEVPLDSVGGANPQACGQSLREACGEVIMPALSVCESSYDGHEASCEALPMLVELGESVSTLWEHRCKCDGGEVQVREALTCHRALQASCPDALPPSAVHAEEGELGALCQTASDCDLAACYVPGNEQEPICSALCESDDDCPAGALCAVIDPQGGHCFAICESNAECGLRNDAQENPLYCASRSAIDIAGLGGDDDDRHICIQKSEP